MVSSQAFVFLLCSVMLSISSGLDDGQKNEDYDPETNDLMFGDAEPQPTPAVCSEGTTCGFLEYDDFSTGTHHHTFTHYCHCPEGLTCIREGTNMELRYFYFKCYNVTKSEPESSNESSPVPSESSEQTSSNVQPSEAAADAVSSTPSSKRIGYVNEEL